MALLSRSVGEGSFGRIEEAVDSSPITSTRIEGRKRW